MDQFDQIPVSTRVNTRSSLACLQCRSKHVKCDGKKPQCTRCTSLEKECQYTASRRGGLDRAALAERRKRLATGTDPRLSMPTPQIPLEIGDATISNLDVQPMIGMNGVVDALDGGSSSTPALPTPDTPQIHIENLAEDPLIISYYTNFHDFHPFVLPRQHLIRLCNGPQHSSLNFDPLIAVMRLVGNLYSTHQWSDSLKLHAETCIAQLPPSDPIVVQSRLLYSIALFWHNFKIEAKQQIDAAADIAKVLCMHKHEFATTYGAGDDVLTESWRRTWWMLFIVDAYFAGTLGTMNLKTIHIEATVELPCEEIETSLNLAR
ncbi:hypothetical protein NW762_013871 [Fusarium torreyae]|uniref:Zn(2)-C6 fungal-type domain-containing protein n=1 Tax=Fusarium torreyae TaxID=1237075 RepID=A0A9W8RN65_9HYPO|nr:hypothetical protein NW762_013871 [Fusarium torreyae]